MHRRLGPAAAILILVVAGACGEDAPVIDAAVPSDAARLIDAARVVDAAPSLSWVDFAITGCAGTTSAPDQDAGVGDAGVAQPCTGAAPLAVELTAVAPAAIETYVWSFGDGQSSDQPHPRHVYEQPGSYDVSLTVGGAGGTASVMRPGLVQVEPADLGGRCTLDSQCQTNECVCDQAAECTAGPAPGLCTADCSADQPCAAGVCADLSAGTATEDWQRALCLPACAADDDCAEGLTCQELRAPGGGWVTACFAPGLLRAVGQSCADAAGTPDHSVCASGYCAALGARGVCSAPCTAGACPPSAACADFTAGASLCLARCDDTESCDRDPWLACEPPGGSGPLDFTVDEPAADAGYCAPKTCETAADCGADSSCNSGFCGP